MGIIIPALYKYGLVSTDNRKKEKKWKEEFIIGIINNIGRDSALGVI